MIKINNNIETIRQTLNDALAELDKLEKEVKILGSKANPKEVDL